MMNQNKENIMKIKFKPNICRIRTGIKLIDSDIINAEPILSGASWEFARNNGGKLTNEILDWVEYDVINEIPRHAKLGYHPVIDTKVVHLMPGQYPCIPGWHCDGVLRSNSISQPNMETINEDINHYIANFSDTNISPTDILTEPTTINVDKRHVWKSVDKYLTSHLHHYESYGSGTIVKFNRQTVHRCTPAQIRGTRFFFRLSFYHMPVLNKFRNQVQVYSTMGGW